VIVGLDHVQICAPPGCEPEARAFYGELLGLGELPKPPLLAARGGVWFALGAQELHVGVDDAFAPARRAHPAMMLSSPAALEALAKRLLTHGDEVRWDTDLPGVQRLYTDDPFGNRIELQARPPVER